MIDTRSLWYGYTKTAMYGRSQLALVVTTCCLRQKHAITHIPGLFRKPERSPITVDSRIELPKVKPSPSGYNLMTNQLSEAVRSLQRAKEKAAQRLDEVEQERREIKTSLKTLDSALRALGSGDTTQTTRSRAPTTAEISELIAQLLAVHGKLSVAQLRKMIPAELGKQGLSRMGLGLRLEHAIKDGRFQQLDGEVRLRTELGQVPIDNPREEN